MNTHQDIIRFAQDTLLSESKSIEEAAHRIDESFALAVEKIFECKGRVIITGIGKSAHIAQKIVATLNSTGTPSSFLHASEAVHGDLGMIQKEDLIICISKSGNSPEIKVLVPLLKRDQNILIAITANKTSFLGSSSDYIIDAWIEEESCPNHLAPTNSTTVQLALGDAIAVALMQLRNFSTEDFAKYHPGGALGKKLLLKVKDLMDRTYYPLVNPEASIQDVIVEISTKRLGATAVVKGKQIVGIITDGDIRRMLQKNNDFLKLKAEDIMSKHPKSIDSSQLVSEALEVMEQNTITQLVVTENEAYRGIIHLHDIIKEGIL